MRPFWCKCGLVPFGPSYLQCFECPQVDRVATCPSRRAPEATSFPCICSTCRIDIPRTPTLGSHPCPVAKTWSNVFDQAIRLDTKWGIRLATQPPPNQATANPLPMAARRWPRTLRSESRQRDAIFGAEDNGGGIERAVFGGHQALPRKPVCPRRGFAQAHRIPGDHLGSDGLGRWPGGGVGA